MFFFNYLYCDAPEHYQMTIQDPATEVLEWMIDLYDLICFQLIIIISIIFILLLSILFDYIHHTDSQRSFSHSTELEVFWTIVPALLLISIAYPSFSLLYALDDLTTPDVTIKIIGHQWYWSYEHFVTYKRQFATSVSFDSYMVNTDELEDGTLRLLEVDNRLCLPVKTHIRLLITSSDVLHSWTIPSFGIKVDACPGRLNQATLFIKRPGLYFGQCSEICGVNHGFMPIVILATSFKNFGKHIDAVFAHHYGSGLKEYGELHDRLHQCALRCLKEMDPSMINKVNETKDKFFFHNLDIWKKSIDEHNTRLMRRMTRLVRSHSCVYSDYSRKKQEAYLAKLRAENQAWWDENMK